MVSKTRSKRKAGFSYFRLPTPPVLEGSRSTALSLPSVINRHLTRCITAITLAAVTECTTKGGGKWLCLLVLQAATVSGGKGLSAFPAQQSAPQLMGQPGVHTDISGSASVPG